MSDGAYTAYTGDPCPNCGRVRMLTLGVCDKCYFDLRTNEYASDARRYEADHGRAPGPEDV